MLKIEDNSEFTIQDLILYCTFENGDPITKENLLTINSIICIHKNGEKLYFDVDIERVEDYVMLSFTDITQYKEATETIKESAMIDELTSLYNRKKLDEIRDGLVDKNICVIIFDIDDFKKINDKYGHLKGDEVLEILANVVKTNLRESDIVVRWGGEEFLILIENLTDKHIAISLAEKLRKRIEQIYIEEVGHFSCSFGVHCGFIHSFDEILEIFDKADEALYRAKREGKNRVVYL
jgi:diguanylate cyclase (GGDEF)-like protein